MNQRFQAVQGKIPVQGFIKTVNPRVESLSAEERTALIRRGNALYNSGDFEKAKRIFLTTGYSDGLIRLGDRCLAQKDFYEALRLYKIAPAREKADALIEKMAWAIKEWLRQ